MTKIKGKHIVASKDYYLPRHGIGVSKDEVVCSVQVSPDALDTQVIITSIDEFLRGGKLIKIEYPSLINNKEVVIYNAVTSIGIQLTNHDLLGDNFAYWCITSKLLPVDSEIFGQHLRVKRGLYYHHGIGIDNSMVVHYGDPSGGTSKSNSVIHLTSYQEFKKNGFVEIITYRDRHPLLFTRNRAISTIGQYGYDVISSNCEHFATWCASGVKHSRQVKAVEKSILSGFEIGLGALVLGAFIGAIAEVD